MKPFRICLSLLLGLAAVAPRSLARDANAAAAEILERADLNRGLCCVLGAGDGSLPLALARQSELLVYVREPDAAKVADLRGKADEAGFAIQRLLVEAGPLDRVPFAANTVDFIVCRQGDATGLADFEPAESLRALRPAGSVFTQGFDGEAWTATVKAVPEGMDEWSHWEKSPDNNPVSEDTLIKAPYMTQFMARPWYIGMPAITTAAGGRTFLAMGHIAHHEREWDQLNRIVARNGYNGIILWERKLPDDYLVHRSAFVATEDIYYMIDGDHVLKLDAKTGEERGKIEIPGFNGDWKWIAMADGVLYALAGEPGDGVTPIRGNRSMGGWSWADLSKGLRNGQDGRHIPHGFGDTVAAYDIEKGKVLWTHTEDSLIDSRGLAIRDDHFYLYCPDKHFRCLNRKTGAEIWTTGEKITLELIEEPGRGLTSTPGWRTQTMVVATPDSLVVQGQTRMNVIGLSTKDGSMLWQKSKVTNNPNAIYVDGKVVLGVGEGGSHIAIDPKTGTVEDDLKFLKRSCTRLTASTDSFFVRGEGMTRYDRATQNVTIDGAVRPACNDGVIPANGLIYLGPWACDCNLSLIGNVARCSAGDFRFDIQAAGDESRLERSGFSPSADKPPLAVSESDWATWRGNPSRSAATTVAVKGGGKLRWQHEPKRAFTPTDPVAAGGLVFLGGEDGRVRAVDGESGEPRWTFQTGGPVKFPPTLAAGRAYVGSGDGHAYCLDAATGALLWRFRAAPVERHVMIYGSVSSTWPVNTGVLVHDGVAYFGAGIVDHDGTYLHAIDAESGELRWENNSSGHLNADQRKGVSVQGNLTIHDGHLVMAGGNVVSPARYDLKTGECLEQARENGQPQSNGGKFVGVFNGDTLLAGGRILYSSPRNVSTKGSFELWSPERASMTLSYGGVVPAWNETMLAIANFKYGRVSAFDTATLAARAKAGFEDEADPRKRVFRNLIETMAARNEERWQSNLGDNNEFEALSIALAPNAIVTVARYQDIRRARPQYFLVGLDPADGHALFQVELAAEPLPGGLAIDRNGHIVVSLLEGGLACFGG